MNESIFLLHIIVTLALSFAALRFGKELLIVWMALQGILANLFVVKQITLFGLNVTPSDVYAVGTFFSLNLIQEYYSKETAQKAIGVAAFSQACFLIMSQFQLAYIPSPTDMTQSAFVTLLTPYPRILGASLLVFYSVQQLDLKVFQKVKDLIPTRSFALRNGICMIVSQFLDTILFSFLGLYGIVSSIFDVIVMSFCIKIILILFSTPFSVFVKLLQPKRST